MASWEHLADPVEERDAGNSSQPPTSAEWSERDTPPTSAGTPFTEENVRRFTEEGPGAPHDRDADPVLDHEESSHNAILSMGERRAPAGEESAGPRHELQIPEQRPNTAVGSPEGGEDFPSSNMLQAARTLATTMVILRRDLLGE